MTVMNLIKNFQALITIRLLPETLPKNGKLKFNSKTNDSRSNYNDSSGNINENINNEQKYNYNNFNNFDDDDKDNSNDK